MESYFRPGLSMPLQRHLSRLYNDTKKSSDFVKEPVQNAEDPEIKALHRKLRIQKDRLVSWGLEWSDPGQSSEVLIDSSISRAGLSEVVGSIMSTIKDTLAEVEPLWLSSKRLVGGGDDSKGSSGDHHDPRDRKLPAVTWDKARFIDLVRDLTVSIDTLYDLSRTRSSGASYGDAGGTTGTSGAPTTGSSSKPVPSWANESRSSPSDDLRPFESSRLQVPQQIVPSTLSKIESPHLPESLPGTQTREVVFMGKQAYADFARAHGIRHPYAPLLLEYAYINPLYATTNVMPAMGRFEKLSLGLQVHMQRPSSAWIGIPRLFGYFEDMEHSRLGVVYHFPPGYNAVVPSDAVAHHPRSCLLSLGDLLASPGAEPRLEVKFRLASNLANSVFEMHARGIAHGRLGDANVLFGRSAQPGTDVTDISRADLRKPLVSGFELFPDTPSPDGDRQSLLFRHPLNPQSFSPQSTPIVDADPRAFDLYSVAMLLLSIGMWTKVENLVPHREAVSVSETVLDQLAVQCGTLYMKAVQTCWNAMETVISAKVPSDSHLTRVELKVSRCLDACCVLDTLSSFEDPPEESIRRNDTFGMARTSSVPVAIPESVPMSAPTTSPTGPMGYMRKASMGAMPPSLSDRKTAGKSLEKGYYKEDSFYRPKTTLDSKPPVPPRVPSSKSLKLTKSEVAAAAAAPAPPPPAPPAKTESVRMKLFPQVPLPPAIIEQWHSFLMPQINFALQSFYRKHPESVEISLESVGDSPRNTKPTVLIVCTSVQKVRHILKRKLGEVFDGSSGFSLKVCSGRVLRSRKDGQAREADPLRSQGSGPTFLAANSQFQARPKNGASIGAWVGDRHLPPVSFGGLVIIDDKPFGMTVHHMLDDPDAMEAAAAAASAGDGPKTLRSTSASAGSLGGAESEATAAQEVEALGQSLLNWYADLQGDASSAASTSGDDYACEFSDTNSDLDSDITSNWSDSSDEGGDEDTAGQGEPGDLPGVEPGFGEGYVVTQPALDDVEKDFYPDEETQDDDHLDSCGLGDIFASSGVRRRVDEQGLVHEIDWALFEFKEERRPPDNDIPYLPLDPSHHRAKNVSSVSSSSSFSSLSASVLHPKTVAPSSALPGLEVQCMARTSGLQTGRILPTITSVKIYGRASPSHTYQISGSRSLASPAQAAGPTAATDSGGRPMPMGIPGDSGAWIVEREHGHLCGHVLAWSERKKVAYLCPMDVLLLDIAETLEACEVRLPGGDAVVKIRDPATKPPKEPWKGAGQSEESTGPGQAAGGDGGSKAAMEADEVPESRESRESECMHADRLSPSQTGDFKEETTSRPTKMVELAGRFGKMHMGGGNVEAAC